LWIPRVEGVVESVRTLWAPRARRIAFGAAVVLALVLTSGAGAARSGRPARTPQTKPLCVGPPSITNGEPVAQCDAWVKTSSGKLVPMAPPSQTAGAAKPSTTASPDAGGSAQRIWPDELKGLYGLGFTNESASQTIGVVDAWGNSKIASDLAQLDSDFDLGGPFPACSGSVTASCFEVVNQTGGSTRPACTGTAADCEGWAFETALDVETVHIVCGWCKVILVEASSDSGDDLAAAEDEAAVLGANVISNSYGIVEGGTDGLQSADFDALAPHYVHNGVVVVASSGDSAYAGGTQFPADIDSAVSVGGTTLSTNGNTDTDTGVSYGSETAWFTPSSGSTPASGAGSGCSIFQTAEPWQSSANGWSATHCGAERAVADVSADADPASGLMVYNAMGCTPPACYWQIGGTSLSAPIIAGIYGLAANPRSSIENVSLPYFHTNALRDVTSGSTGSCASTICQAAPGYDGPTGLGTPSGIQAFVAPRITSFSSRVGAPGYPLTINGLGFTGATAVKFNGVDATSFTVVSDSQISAVEPSGAMSGLVTVSTPVGTVSSPSSFYFEAHIDSFSPTSATTGSTVTITGSNLTGASSVTFNGTNAASFSIDSDTQIRATIAAGTTSGHVLVTTLAGTAQGPGTLYILPAITGFSPTHASVHSTVTLTGTSFTGATSVKVNGTSAPFSVVSSTSITLTVPAGASSGTIQVTTPGGTSTSSGSLTIGPPPAITSFTPESGSIGTTVTITGTNLDHVLAVEIGHVLTVPTSASSTQVVFTIPPGAVSGPIRLLAANGSVTSVDSLTITS
jgi:hypothetical protein